MQEKDKTVEISELLLASGCTLVREKVEWNKNRKKGFVDLVGYTIGEDGNLVAQVLVEIKSTPQPIHSLIQQTAEASQILGASQVLFSVAGTEYWFDAITFLPITEPPRFQSAYRFLLNPLEIQQIFLDVMNILRGKLIVPQYLDVLGPCLLVRYYLNEKNRLNEWDRLGVDSFTKLVRDAEKYFDFEFNENAYKSVAEVLPQIINAIQLLPPSGPVVSGEFHEMIYKVTKDMGRQSGQYVTPPHLVSFIKEIIKSLPLSGGHAIELAAGFGFLLRALAHTASIDSFTGVEKVQNVCMITKLVFLLEADENKLVRIVCDDAMGYEANVPEGTGYSLVIVDPPMGGSSPNFKTISKVAQFNGAKVSDLMIEKGLRLVKPGGFIVAIVPESTLFSSGASKFLRDLILEQSIVEAIVKMPDHILKPYTGARINLLVIRKKNDHNETAENLFVAKPEQLEDLEQIAVAFTKWRQGGVVGEFSTNRTL